MLQISLIYPTPDGSKEILIEADKTTFGRGSEAVHRFADDGLSRLHAAIYREGDRVWVADENSSNGTFVNGQPVTGGGTPLKNGDNVRIGHHTDLKVRIVELSSPVTPPPMAASHSPSASQPSLPSGIGLLPVALIACALFIVTLSAIFIGYTILASTGGDQNRASVDSDEIDDEGPTITNTKSDVPPKTDDKPGTAASAIPSQTGDLPPMASPAATPVNDILKGRKYYELSDAEKRQYLSERAMKVAQIIGNNSPQQIPPVALDKIKSFTEGYVSRRNAKGRDGCPSRNPWGDSLQATFERASRNAPFINKAFRAKDIDARIGLYLAMIESEHCVCLQSPTRPLGLFQFTYATAKAHFENSEALRRDATDKDPDIRCQPEPAARAAASYMKVLTARFGTDPSSVPLAIGSYNSGEGGLSSNLVKALESNTGLPRDFWTLIENGEKLSKQFQAENFKYVPKFFAAAIIGENPQDFGLALQPISTYDK